MDPHARNDVRNDIINDVIHVVLTPAKIKNIPPSFLTTPRYTDKVLYTMHILFVGNIGNEKHFLMVTLLGGHISFTVSFQLNSQ